MKAASCTSVQTVNIRVLVKTDINIIKLNVGEGREKQVKNQFKLSDRICRNFQNIKFYPPYPLSIENITSLSKLLERKASLLF